MCWVSTSFRWLIHVLDYQEEKEKLINAGFHDWTKRDFNNYVRACEKWGRNNLKEILKDVFRKVPCLFREDSRTSARLSQESEPLP